MLLLCSVLFFDHLRFELLLHVEDLVIEGDFTLFKLKIKFELQTFFKFF